MRYVITLKYDYYNILVYLKVIINTYEYERKIRGDIRWE